MTAPGFGAADGIFYRRWVVATAAGAVTGIVVGAIHGGFLLRLVRSPAGPQVRVGMLSKISRADLARFIADELAEPRFRRETVFVAG